MSQLVTLLTNSSIYNRLNNIPANPSVATSRTFSVRKQSDDAAGSPAVAATETSPARAAVNATRQDNASNAFADEYQKGFTVYKNTVATNPTSFRKSNTENATDFTGNFAGTTATATSTTVAENTYTRKVNNTAYTRYGTYVLNRNTYDSKYTSQFSSAPGVQYTTNLP